MTYYERIEPMKPCVSPDGHAWVDERTYVGYIPVAIFCPRCGEQWGVAVFDGDRPRETTGE